MTRLRHVVLDTETTGIGHELGHRIIEIGCVELLDRKLTGNHFHTYLNPNRAIDDGAFKVHGISTEFLQDKPSFKSIAPAFLQFIDGAEIIIHNAPFDVGFINAELKHINWPKTLTDYGRIFDTLVFAREKHPGQRNNLDALCKRYAIDNTNRQLHGALLDAEILARVYLAMTGGQKKLIMDEELSRPHSSDANPLHASEPLISQTPVYFANAEEIAKHEEFLQFLLKKSNIDHFSDAEIP